MASWRLPEPVSTTPAGLLRQSSECASSYEYFPIINETVTVVLPQKTLVADMGSVKPTARLFSLQKKDNFARAYHLHKH